jgi:hypothetical protein
MKTIITILVLFLTVSSYGQTHNFDEDSIQYYFLKHLDTMRNELHNGIPKTIVNDNASNACLHHNKFLADIQQNDGSIIMTHDEFKIKDGVKYKGNDTIIGYYMDRNNYYNTNKDFASSAEVAACVVLWTTDDNQGNITNFIHQYMTNEWIGKRLLYSLKQSDSHNRVISSFGYNVVAIDVSIINGIVYLTMVTGSKIEYVNGKEIHISNLK